MRLLRWIRAALELALIAWSTYQLIALALEWLRSPAPATDRESLAGTYPNTYGIRLEPLTPDETAAALAGERATARRLAELTHPTPRRAPRDRLGSLQPAVAESTPSAAGELSRDGVGG